MKNVLFVAGLGMAILSPLVSQAQQSARTPVLFELFTSEGCSSCPPADRLLQSLDRSQPFANVDLIVLSEHVDYWNEGGWADPFSAKLFTERQKRYAEQFKLDSIYTPQRVVDGQLEGVGGSEKGAKADVTKAGAMKKVHLSLTGVSASGKHIRFRAETGEWPAADAQQATLYIAIAEDNVRSSVRAGENAGRSLEHVAVARTLSVAGTVKAGQSLLKHFSVDLPSGLDANQHGLRLVAFLQVDKTQKIIGVTQVKL